MFRLFVFYKISIYIIGLNLLRSVRNDSSSALSNGCHLFLWRLQHLSCREKIWYNKCGDFFFLTLWLFVQLPVKNFISVPYKTHWIWKQRLSNSLKWQIYDGASFSHFRHFAFMLQTLLDVNLRWIKRKSKPYKNIICALIPTLPLKSWGLSNCEIYSLEKFRLSINVLPFTEYWVTREVCASSCIGGIL